LWLIETNLNPNSININYYTYSILRRVWSNHRFFQKFLTNQYSYANYRNSLGGSFTFSSKKSLNQTFKVLHKSSVIAPVTLTKSSNTLVRLHPKTFQLFKVFLNTCISPIKSAFKVHPSSKLFFMGYTRLSTTVFNISKLFSRWQDFYSVVYNIFFYNVPILTFGTALFESELLALNWVLSTQLKRHWKFVRPYIFTKENKINSNYNTIFALLKLNSFNTAFVIDTNYHKRTLYYLRQFYFFTIGVVPVTSDLYKVDFALPSASESATSHLFFIRLVYAVKKDVEHIRYVTYNSHWSPNA